MVLLGPWNVSSAAAAAEPAPLKAEEIVAQMVANNDARAARLRSYRSTRVYELDYRGFPSDKHARMVVNAVYEDGEKKLTVVSEEGSKLLLEHVLRKIVASETEANTRENLAKTALSPDNYEFTLLDVEQAGEGGTPCYVLQVTPRRHDKFLYQGKIWIHPQDFAVVRIQARPAKKPSFWIADTLIEHEYRSTGGFWLPATNRSTTKVRFGGRAVLTIEYGDYDVSASAPAAQLRAR
jgi:hypothetical protein